MTAASTARGKKVRSAYRVLEGDDIRIRLPPPAPLDLEPAAIPLDIVYEDDVLLVVDKPARMVVHPAAGNRQGTLVQALLHHFPALAAAGDAVRPGIVHRKGQDYRVKINSSGVFVDIGNRKCFSTSSVTRVTGPKHTEEEIFLYPRESYRITHQRDEDGNHFLVIGEMV